MRRTASVLALLCLLSCKRSEEDKAARQRIFSQQQESAGGSAQGRELLDAAALADQPQVAERVLQMQQAEVAQRLGPHRAQQRVQFAWFRGPGMPDGGSEVSLSEETTLLDGPGEDFSVRLANDHNQGLELVWVKGEVFVKSLYGPFHKRRTDRTDPPRVREQAMSGLATFDRLARGLKLKKAGEATSDGRRVVRYSVTGFGARPSQQERTDLPPPQYPDDNVDPDTARRLELWQKEEPSRVSGTVIVDAATSAPLACDLQGHFKVPGNSQGPAAELDLHTVLVTSAIGRDPGLKAPPFEPETTVPHAVKDPLRFLGKAPGTTPPAAEEPDETEDEEPAPPK